jgi:thiol-disulfide isomerase/thioredoxin
MRFIPLLFAGLLAFANPVSAQRFDGANSWLNSPALSEAGLRGKVVLVDFGTYTCINWLRTLPYVRAWADKYRAHGLVVIGVHTPEFEFEKNLDNVRRAVRDMRIGFPIAIDNDFAVWRAFKNHAWPAVYLLDAKGRVRFSHHGEEEYVRIEKTIQQLLTDAGATGVPRDLVSVQGRGIEAAPDWANLKSPETYLGSARAQSRVRAEVSRLRLNQWTLSGDWSTRKDAVRLEKSDGRIAIRFRARDVHLVMGPTMLGAGARFRVLIDGKPPGAARGSDVDEDGSGFVSHQRLYQLIRQPLPISEHLFEIEFLDPGIEAFAFTFG